MLEAEGELVAGGWTTGSGAGDVGYWFRDWGSGIQVLGAWAVGFRDVGYRLWGPGSQIRFWGRGPRLQVLGLGTWGTGQVLVLGVWGTGLEDVG